MGSIYEAADALGTMGVVVVVPLSIHIPVAADWSVIGAVATIVSIPVGAVVAVVLYRLQISRALRAFGYEVASRSLFQVGGEARSRVEIRIDGEPVDDVHLVQVALRNTGKMTILREDFDGPIELSLPESCSPIVSTLTMTAEPDDIRATARFRDDGNVEIDPVLMNAGDRLVAAVMVKSDANLSEIRVHARIAGVKRPSSTTDPVGPQVVGWLRGWAEGGITLVAVGIGAVALLLARSAFGPKDDQVVLKSGQKYCAAILSNVGAQTYITQSEEETDRTVIVPRAAIARINKDGC